MGSRHIPYFDLAHEYFGGLAHMHTRLSNHPGHRESDLTVKSLLRRLEAAGLCGGPGAPIQYVMFNEHSSDPGKPRPLGRLSLRAQRLLRQRRRTLVYGVPVLFGLEVSILPDGRTDLTPQLAQHCAAVIASRHWQPADKEHDPEAILANFEAACLNPDVGVIGHPMRYIENVTEIDWRQVFARAAVTGTAVEININLFWREIMSENRRVFWRKWIRDLGESKAIVFMGMDIHNYAQAEFFINAWQELEQGIHNELAELIELVYESNIRPEQVVTSSYQRVQQWMSIDKPTRAQVFLS